MPMKVSVIVPAFNATATLEAAVHSLLATGYPDLEILVVDDGSTDSTLDLAHELEACHSGVVRVLSHTGCAHRGVSASRNLGIHESRGELIAFLDADDVVLPNRFSISVAMLQEQPSFDGVYELTQIENRNAQVEEGSEQWRDGAIFGIAQPLFGEELLRELMAGIPWGTCAFLCRRSLFDRIGSFDEGRSMAEDCHLWLRAAAGANIVPADPLGVVCLYIRHGGNSYHYSLERQVDLLDAIADAGAWIKRCAPWQWDLWKTCFDLYFTRCIETSQQERRLDIAIQEIQLCLRFRHYSTLAKLEVLQQIAILVRQSAKAKLQRTGLVGSGAN